MASQIGREHLRRHWRKYLLLFVVLPISFLVANGIASALLLLFISRSDGVGKMQHGAVHHQTPILAQQDSNVNNSPAAQDRKAELKHLWDFEVRPEYHHIMKWTFTTNLRPESQWSYSGIPTFAHLPYHKCLIEPDVAFDVGIIGAPFDTAVSYRTGLHTLHLPVLSPRDRVINADKKDRSTLRTQSYPRSIIPPVTRQGLEPQSQDQPVQGRAKDHRLRRHPPRAH